MNLLERYLGVTVLRAILLGLAVFVSLLVFLSFVDEMGNVGKGSFSELDAFLLALLSIPRYTFEVFPVAALFGSLLGLGGLARHGELVAIRAAGISVSQLAWGLFKAGLAMVLVVVLVGEFLAPAAEGYAQQLRAERLHQQVTFRSAHGLWARDGDAFVNIQQILPDGRLTQIHIYEFDADNRLRLATEAASARYQAGSWQLSDIEQIRLFDDHIEKRHLDTATWGSLLNPSLLSLLSVKPTMLPVWSLYEYIGFMRANGQEPGLYAMAFWSKISTPVASLVLLLFALPFVLGSPRSGAGAGRQMMLGIVLGGVFYLLNKGLSLAAVAYGFSPLLAALTPPLLFLGGAWWLARKRL